MKRFLILTAAALFLSESAFAMNFESVRLSVWLKGESILGEEFVAMNESIVDYLASLKHPTDPIKAIRYQCNVKMRRIRPSVFGTTTTSSPGYVEVRAVYDLKDCAEIQIP